MYAFYNIEYSVQILAKCELQLCTVLSVKLLELPS